MTKYLAWIGLGLLALWLVKVTGLIAAIVLFLMAGIVPVFGYSIPPVAMLALLAIFLFLFFFWVKRQKLGKQIRELKAKHQPAPVKAPAKKRKKHTTTRARARHSRPKAVAR